jgi:hypothetical protein
MGLKEGAFSTLLMVTWRLDTQLVIWNVILFDILMQVMLHVEDEMYRSEGKTIVKVEGAGLFVGKFIVRSTLIG